MFEIIGGFLRILMIIAAPILIAVINANYKGKNEDESR